MLRRNEEMSIRGDAAGPGLKREFFIDNLLVRIHFIIVMIRWTGLAPWEFESPFPGSLASTFLVETERSRSGVMLLGQASMARLHTPARGFQFKNNYFAEM